MPTPNLPTPSSDISREGLTGAKVMQLGRLFRPRHNHAIAKVSKFNLIDIARINKLLGTNFKGVVLDIDECVAQHGKEVLPENVDAIINMIEDGIKVVIFSNMKFSDRYLPLLEAVRTDTGKEIQIIMSKFAKPDKRGFDESVAAMALQEGEQALMIGDNFMTDGGAIAAGLPFMKVDPIKTQGESALDKAKRLPQTGSRSLHSGVSNFYDAIGQLFGKRRVLRDADFIDEDPTPPTPPFDQ